MNADRLQQDHPCVIETIRRRYLHPPADLDVPYNLVAPNKADPSVGQATSILNYLGNQVRGTQGKYSNLLIIQSILVSDKRIFHRMRSSRR